MKASPVAIGSATYFPDARELVVADSAMVLEPRLADLLSCLVAAPGAVARDELLNTVWGDAGSDEALTQAISKLRRHLGDEQRPYRLIRTIPKFGYALETAATIEEPADADRNSTAPLNHPGRNRSFYLGMAAGVGLICAVILLYSLLSRPTVIEREMILCPPDAPQESCAEMLQPQN
ncbi:MAG: winged helix-turn-helix domain-containing protein [Pseudomonadota bacterium]